MYHKQYARSNNFDFIIGIVMYGSAVGECILGLSRGKVLHINICVGAPQYTMLIFGFSFLQVLAGIKKDTM